MKVSNNYRDLAAQIKQGRDRKKPWRNIFGCYRDKIERMLRGEEPTGRMRSLKHAAVSTYHAVQKGPGTGQDSPCICLGAPEGCAVACSRALVCPIQTPTGSPLYCTQAPTADPASNWHPSPGDFGKSHLSSAEGPMGRQVMRLNTTKWLCPQAQGIITPAWIS